MFTRQVKYRNVWGGKHGRPQTFCWGGQNFPGGVKGPACPPLRTPMVGNVRKEQWFPTRVPRHTRVPWGGAGGAAKFWNPLQLARIPSQIIHNILVEVPKIFFSSMLGCRQIVQKKVKKHWDRVIKSLINTRV